MHHGSVGRRSEEDLNAISAEWVSPIMNEACTTRRCWDAREISLVTDVRNQEWLRRARVDPCRNASGRCCSVLPQIASSVD